MPNSALDAYKTDKTSAELMSTHKVNLGKISTWKKTSANAKSDNFIIIDRFTIIRPMFDYTPATPIQRNEYGIKIIKSGTAS